jgi:hypothetical protein
VGAICTFVGLIHGEAIGFAQSLPVAFSYLAVAGILLIAAKSPKAAAATEADAGESECTSIIAGSQGVS